MLIHAAIQAFCQGYTIENNADVTNRIGAGTATYKGATGHKLAEGGIRQGHAHIPRCHGRGRRVRKHAAGYPTLEG